MSMNLMKFRYMVLNVRVFTINHPSKFSNPYGYGFSHRLTECLICWCDFKKFIIDGNKLMNCLIS